MIISIDIITIGVKGVSFGVENRVSLHMKASGHIEDVLSVKTRQNNIQLAPVRNTTHLRTGSSTVISALMPFRPYFCRCSWRYKAPYLRRKSNSHPSYSFLAKTLQSSQ